jgi:hypothetical protein
MPLEAVPSDRAPVFTAGTISHALEVAAVGVVGISIHSRLQKMPET